MVLVRWIRPYINGELYISDISGPICLFEVLFYSYLYLLFGLIRFWN